MNQKEKPANNNNMLAMGISTVKNVVMDKESQDKSQEKHMGSLFIVS